jgi:hypothetical protein
LREAVDAFDVESIRKAQKRAKASRKEIVTAAHAIEEAVRSLLKALEG